MAGNTNIHLKQVGNSALELPGPDYNFNEPRSHVQVQQIKCLCTADCYIRERNEVTLHSE